MAEHEVYVRSHWHNDTTSGLEAGCSCGKVLLGDSGDAPCPEEVSLGKLNQIFRDHLPPLDLSGLNVMHGSCNQPDCRWCNPPRPIIRYAGPS